MEPTAKARVLVVDDHPLVCKAVSQLLNRQGDLACCNTVQSAAETVPAILKHRPDLVLLDLKLTDGDGLKLTALLLLEFPALRVLVLSQFDDVGCAEDSLKAGACGYVTKRQTAGELMTAIRTVLAGKIYLNPKISAALLKGPELVKPPAVNGYDPLTKRETQVFQLIGVGLRTRDIANKLNVSIKTVETYREALKQKLGLKNSPELTHFAICWMERQPTGGNIR